MVSVRMVLSYFLLCLCLTLNADELRGRVVRIADGDTITILDSANVQHRIRLDRIDAPEKKQAYGEASKKHLSDLIGTNDVRVTWSKTDRYGRKLGVVYVGDKDINLQMVKDGYAWHYKQFCKAEPTAEAEANARKLKVGLWAEPNPVEPWNFRKERK